MQKIAFKNSRGKNIVGVIHKANSKRCVIISHGFTACKDRERFVKLAESLSRERITALRFDFSGCGESDNDYITVKSQVDDLRSAIKYMKTQGYKEIGLWGESLGGLVSLKAFDGSIICMVVCAPVTDSRKPSIEKEIVKTNENTSERGREFIIHKDGREFKITKDYFDERECVDQNKLLSIVECPVLIIQGDKDTTIQIMLPSNAFKETSPPRLSPHSPISL